MVKKTFLHIIITVVITCVGLLACQNARPPVSAEDLYCSQMTQKNTIEFYQFPQALESIKGRHSGTIFANEKDTLQLLCSYPNLADEKNRYPLYVMCDNHGNYWTLVQEKQGKYKLYRQDAVIPDKGVDMIEAFCQGGVFPAWVVIMLSIIINCAATTKEEKVSINSVIKATLLMFFIGGCFGILTM